MPRAYVLPLTAGFRDFASYFDVCISTAWGGTEVGLPLGTGAPEKAGSCGVPAPGYELRIVDSEDQPVPHGDVGELIVRHDQPWRITSGYLGRPEETAKAWRNGWFHTGDALRQDTDGTYFFVDRMKDYIRYRGQNISSLEVEAEVAEHSEVAAVACIGVAGGLGADTVNLDLSEASGSIGDEDVMIFVVRCEGSDLDEEGLIRWLIPRLPRFMVPRYVRFISELPVTATGKVRKVLLREQSEGSRAWDREAAGIVVPR